MADDSGVTFSWGGGGRGWSLLVHGGAGDVPADAVARHIEGCRAAAAVGGEILRAGGSALDAVGRAVAALEDDPCFNAGTGACLNADGLIELDAAIMDGEGLRAGAVCALPPFKNPIAIARAALDDGTHVLYAADGASRFAMGHGFAPSTSEAMTTPKARMRWEAVRAAGGGGGWAGGTVGAVARDSNGHVAAATSTGGRINKRPGRVGDSPILGAGTYADDQAGACSNTGDGEAVMRLCLGKSAVDWMRGRMDPKYAAMTAIRTLGKRLGADGGIILVDRTGRLGLARNTKTMTWAAVGETLRSADGEAGS